MDYEEWLKSKDLEYREGILYMADVNTVEIAKTYGTPIYVINEDLIRKRYKTLKKVLNSVYKNNQIHFAMKANSSLSILKILKSEGAYFDCTSTGEIYACFKAGISSEKIIYTGNMFTTEDFKFAIENNVLVNLDSISQIKRLAKVYDDLRKEKINEKVLELIPELVARSRGVIAFAQIEKGIKVGMLDPEDLKTIHIIEKRAGQKVIPFYITKRDFENALSSYKPSLKDEFENILKGLKVQLDIVKS